MSFTDGKNSMGGALWRRPMFLAAALVLQISGLTASRVYAHEAGAPFSGAIIDPFSLHHAHIENEQRGCRKSPKNINPRILPQPRSCINIASLIL